MHVKIDKRVLKVYRNAKSREYPRLFLKMNKAGGFMLTDTNIYCEVILIRQCGFIAGVDKLMEQNIKNSAQVYSRLIHDKDYSTVQWESGKGRRNGTG